MKEIKAGKAPGLDGFPVECLKKGGIVVLEWLVRLLNVCFDVGVVPRDWRGACGGSTYGLAWCMYSAPVQREG